MKNTSPGATKRLTSHAPGVVGTVKGVAYGLAALAVFLCSIQWPFPPTAGLEPTWQGALALAHTRGLQFGTQVQFSYGPWGFLSLLYTTPECWDLRIAWEVLGHLALAGTLVLASSSMTVLARWLFLACCVGAACFQETMVLVTVVVLAVAWMVPPGAPSWKTLLAIAWISFFALQKFTFFLVGTSEVLIAAGAAVASGSGRRGILLLLAYAAAYLAWWFGAGQSLGTLIPYWIQGWQLSSGYSSAMGLSADPWILGAGLFLLAWIAVILSRVRLLQGTGFYRLGTALAVACGWFLAWKEGFTRADSHAFGFFIFSAVLAFALAGWAPKPAWTFGALLLLGAGSIASMRLFGPGFLPYGTTQAWYRLRTRPREILSLGNERTKFDAMLKASQASSADPALRAAVGAHSIDSLTMDSGRILLNGLAYAPRPTLQSYCAYTPALSEANRAYFYSARAPDFVAVKLSSLDEHPPGQDDGPALGELVRRYQVVRRAPDYLLLRRKPPGVLDPPKDTELDPITANYGQEIQVPDGKGHAVWMEIDIQSTFLGSLREFLYHAPDVRMRITAANGERKFYRIVPGMARGGFFVRPWLSSEADLAALMEGRGGASAQTVLIEFKSKGDARSWRRPVVRFRILNAIALNGGKSR